MNMVLRPWEPLEVLKQTALEDGSEKGFWGTDEARSWRRTSRKPLK